jgi:hypothetical protein
MAFRHRNDVEIAYRHGQEDRSALPSRVEPKAVLELHLDIGTTAVRGTLVVDRSEIAGFVSRPGGCVRSSEIVDPDALSPIVADVHRALTSRLSERPLVLVNSSSRVTAACVERSVPLGDRVSWVDIADVDTLLDAPDPRVEFEAVHSSQYEYRVDEGAWIADPLGLPGRRLTARAHVVWLRGGGRDVRAVLRSANIDPITVVPSPIHTAMRLLPAARDRDNVAVIDLGAGSAKIYATHRGRVAHLEILPCDHSGFDDDARFDALVCSIGRRLKQCWQRSSRFAEVIITGGGARARPEHVARALGNSLGVRVTVDRALAPGRRRNHPACVLQRGFDGLF